MNPITTIRLKVPQSRTSIPIWQSHPSYNVVTEKTERKTTISQETDQNATSERKKKYNDKLNTDNKRTREQEQTPQIYEDDDWDEERNLLIEASQWMQRLAGE